MQERWRQDPQQRPFAIIDAQIPPVLRETIGESSLTRKVLAIDLARARITEQQGKIPILSEGYVAALKVGGDREFALRSIQDDPEYLSLRNLVIEKSVSDFDSDAEKARKKKQAEEGMDRYEQFLVGDTHPGGKFFASSTPFREYIEYLAENHTIPGPVFQRTLDAVATGNPQIINFITQNRVLLASMDYSHSWLQGRIIGERESIATHEETAEDRKKYLEVYEQAQIRYSAQADEVLGIAFDVNDKSDFRSFLLNNLLVLYASTLMVDDPNHYNPQPRYERIKKLFPHIPRRDWSMFAVYLISAPWESNLVKETLDAEILAGNRRRAEIYALYNINLQDTEVEKFKIPNEHKITSFWVDKYIAGEISEEKFLAIPKAIKTMRAAYKSLPPKIRSGFIMTDTAAFWHSDQLLEDADLEARLIRSGITLEADLKDKIRGKEDIISALAEFGSSVISPLFEAKGDFHGYIIGEWIELYLGGGMDEDELRKTAEGLVQIAEADTEMEKRLELNREEKRVLASEMDFQVYITSDFVKSGSITASLLKNDIFPTPMLLQYLKENPDGLEELKRLKVATKEEKMDPHNSLQRELEYLNYIRLVVNNGKSHQTSYNLFNNLDVHEEKDKLDGLTGKEVRETQAAAYEAAKLYWFIRERQEAGRKTIVIGNRRYGSLFVVEPLKKHLEELNIPTSTYLVSSSFTKPLSVPYEDLSDSFIKDMVKDKPDIVIVDGTSRSFTENAKPRFPRSMRGYLNIFLAYNEAAGDKSEILEKHQESLGKEIEYQQAVSRFKTHGPMISYRIAHYIPAKADTVDFDSIEMPFQEPSMDKPNVIFANPVMDPSRIPNLPREFKNHSPAYFDDPDKKSGDRNEFMVTSRGIERFYGNKTEEEYVSLVQTRIEQELPKMIRQTDPAFS